MALGVVFGTFQLKGYCVGGLRASRFSILVALCPGVLSLGVSCLGAFRLKYVSVSCSSFLQQSRCS